MANAIVNALCKAARYLGYPKKKERRLEAYVNTIIEHEGVPGVVCRFKNLQQTRIYHLEGKRESKWVAMNRHGNLPKRQVEAELWSLSDRKFFAITGAVIQACTEPISQKDIDAWQKVAGQEPLSATDNRYSDHPLSYNALKSYTRVFDDPYKDRMLNYNSWNGMPIGYSQPTADPWSEQPAWIRLNMDLQSISNEDGIPEVIPRMNHFARNVQLPIWNKVQDQLMKWHEKSKDLPFSPDDMKATAYPIGTGMFHPRSTRKGRKTVLNEDDVLYAYRMSQVSSPTWLREDRQIIRNLYTLLALTDMENPFEDQGYQEINLEENPKTAQAAYLFDEDASLLLGDPFGIKVSEYEALSNRNVSGHISFLPKPGLKSRVVANPNRRVQKSLVPLGEALQQATYKSPRFSSHIRVMDQDLGRLEVVNALKAGHRLASVDLTAATDTIDFSRALELTGYKVWQRCHTEEIDRGYQILSAAQDIKEKIQLGYYPGILGDSSEFVGDPDESQHRLSEEFHQPINYRAVSAALLDHSMKCFDAARTGQWIVDNEDGTQRAFRFLHGQPLGTRPSFPFLTLTNAMAARLSGARFYKVVGDDIIINAECYPKYKQIMNDFLGSPINDSKTLVSESVGEFVGYIHTKAGHIFPKKPRITNAKVHDAVTFGFKHSDIASLVDDSRLAVALGIDSLADLPQLDNNDNILARISAKDGWNPSVKDRLIVRVARELVQSKPSARTEKSLNGKAFSAHVQSLIKTDTHAYSAEKRVSNVRFSTEKQVFDHHSMQHRVATESEFRRLKRMSREGKLSQELTKTGTTIVSHNNTDVLVDRQGNLDVYVNNKLVGTGKAKLAEDLHRLRTPGVAIWKTVFSQFSSDSGLMHDVHNDHVDIHRVDGVSHDSDDGPSL